jgi:hypothetical protein
LSLDALNSNINSVPAHFRRDRAAVMVRVVDARRQHHRIMRDLAIRNLLEQIRNSAAFSNADVCGVTSRAAGPPGVAFVQARILQRTDRRGSPRTKARLRERLRAGYGQAGGSDGDDLGETAPDSGVGRAQQRIDPPHGPVSFCASANTPPQPYGAQAKMVPTESRVETSAKIAIRASQDPPRTVVLLPRKCRPRSKSFSVERDGTGSENTTSNGQCCCRAHL